MFPYDEVDATVMDLNVIICTYNRCASLERTLESIRKSRVPDGLRWELTVVDNNSGDDTSAVVERYQDLGTLPIVYLKEPQQGLSHARNRGISESKGKIIAFTDDDVIVDRDWIGNIVRGFAEYDVQCIGGKILPVWEEPKPAWLSEHLWSAIALLDYGDAPMYLDKPHLWGANLAFKAESFRKYGRFDTRRGRVPDKLYGDEEIHFQDKLLEHKERILYLPDVVVHHCIPKVRMKKRYFRKWAFDQGELEGMLFGSCTGRSIMGIPYFAFKNTTLSIFRFAWSLVVFRSDCMEHQRQLLYNLGFMGGRLKKRPAANPDGPSSTG